MRAFMGALASRVRGAHTIYLVRGATAVLEGWRDSTIDVDLALSPTQDTDEILRAIVAVKNELELNVELASPADFIPVPRGWEERARSVAREGPVTFLHYDFYAQALAKLERGHERDLGDVGEMIARGLVERERLLVFFAEIEPELYRYPAVDPASFRRRVETAVGP